jgi:hypothetical protein
LTRRTSARARAGSTPWRRRPLSTSICTRQIREPRPSGGGVEGLREVLLGEGGDQAVLEDRRDVGRQARADDHHLGLDPGPAQARALLGARDRELVGPGLEDRPGDRLDPVSVGVALDHGDQAPAGAALLQRADVRGQRAEVDLDPGAEAAGGALGLEFGAAHHGGSRGC